MVAAMLLVAAACGGKETARAPEVGSDAPSFAATDLAGKSVSLAGLRDTVVLVNTWATWCGPCRREIPMLDSLFREHRQKGFTVVGVSIDDYGMAGDVRAFALEMNMSYPVWLDPGKQFGAQFLTSGVPETFLIDRDGVIRFRYSGALVPGDTALTNAIRRSLGDS